jgi:hypothetical protein
MAVASSYLARLGPKGIVTVLESNTARHSVGRPNNPMDSWYYAAQAEINVCASILQSPEIIKKVWDGVKMHLKLTEYITIVREDQSGVDYYSDSGLPQAALEDREDKKMVEPKQSRIKVHPLDCRVRPSDAPSDSDE